MPARLAPVPPLEGRWLSLGRDPFLLLEWDTIRWGPGSEQDPYF